MSHFSEQVWADYMRGIDSLGNKGEVQAQAALGARERMIDQGVVARHFGLELGDHRAARRDAHGLDAFERWREHAAERIDLSKISPITAALPRG